MDSGKSLSARRGVDRNPGVHMVTTVNKTMVDELPYVLQALPNNYFAQEALAEMERGQRRTGIVNTRGDVNA